MTNDLRLTDAECEAFLDQLFPQGLAGTDVLAEMRAQLAEGKKEARQEAMDRAAPPVVRAYRGGLRMRATRLAAVLNLIIMGATESRPGRFASRPPTPPAHR